MSRSKAEQETVVRWDRESDQAVVWTAATSIRNRLLRRGFAVEVSGGGWKAVIPVKAVSFRSAAAVSRPRRKRAA